MIATTRPEMSVNEPTLYVAFELGKKEWKLAMTSGFGIQGWLRTVRSRDWPGVARAIAQAVRESSGGMPGVQALGLRLPSSGRVQVSMNVVDVERAPLHEVVERVRAEALARDVDVAAGELVGLVPERVWKAAAGAGAELPGVDESRVLERVLGSRLAEWPKRSS